MYRRCSRGGGSRQYVVRSLRTLSRHPSVQHGHLQTTGRHQGSQYELLVYTVTSTFRIITLLQSGAQLKDHVQQYLTKYFLQCR